MKLVQSVLLAGIFSSSVLGAPFVPQDDAAVLERLPLRRSDPVAAVEGLTGNARQGYDELRAAFSRRADAAPEIRLWVLARLAELAWRLGEDAAAERHFRQAQALGVKDNYLLAAYADFLLEHGSAKEASALLRNWSHSDTLLLRIALAAKRQGLPEAQKHVQSLGERFAAACCARAWARIR